MSVVRQYNGVLQQQGGGVHAALFTLVLKMQHSLCGQLILWRWWSPAGTGIVQVATQGS
jgi:hypothetical protein